MHSSQLCECAIAPFDRLSTGTQKINRYTIPSSDLSMEQDWTYTIPDLLALGARQKLGGVSFVAVLDCLITIDTLDMSEAVLALFATSVSHRYVGLWIGAWSRFWGGESMRTSLQ